MDVCRLCLGQEPIVGGDDNGGMAGCNAREPSWKERNKSRWPESTAQPCQLMMVGWLSWSTDFWREGVCDDEMTIDNLVCVGCDGEVCISWDRGTVSSYYRIHD